MILQTLLIYIFYILLTLFLLDAQTLLLILCSSDPTLWNLIVISIRSCECWTIFYFSFPIFISFSFLFYLRVIITLREKISTKFTPRITPSPNTKTNKTAHKPVPASINKVPPSPPLLAKTAKEVNTISKFFLNKKLLNDKSKDRPKPNKSYAQTSKPTVSTAKVFKIKKMFSALSVEKINQVNNIVNGLSKPKPKIQMTTRGLSRKQVIIPMSKENIDSFIKNSLLHVTSMNR